MTYQLSDNDKEYKESNDVNGGGKDDHEGSSVSTTGDGSYCASAGTEFEEVGPDENPVKPNRGGVLRIFNFATKEKIGNAIVGERSR